MPPKKVCIIFLICDNIKSGKNDMKKTLNFILSILIVLILGLVAYYGLAGAIALPVPDFIANFALFYAIFDVFNWTTFVLTLPLLIGIIFSISTFAEKNLKLIFLGIEIAFLVIILLTGFGIIA